MSTKPPSTDKHSAALKMGPGAADMTKGAKGKASKRQTKTAERLLTSSGACEPVSSDQDLFPGLTIIVGPPPPPEPGRLTAETAEHIFQKHVKKAIPREEIEALTHQLNRPWAKEYTHDVWEFHRAIRTILDDAPVVLRAERGHRSQIARQRERGYNLMFEGAKILQSVGVRLPGPDDLPPITKQKKAMANPYHRDWWHVYWLVHGILTKTGNPGTGISATSAGVKITRCLLKVFGIEAPEAAIVKMLDRRQKVEKPNYHLRDARRGIGDKRGQVPP